MPKDENGPKERIIIDADLHVQDPHEIILSYFNTNNDTPFVHGLKKDFRIRLMGMFAALVFLKFFFQELFTNIFSFIFVMAISVLFGFVLSYVLPYSIKVLSLSARKDGLRGIIYQITFMTIIVLIIGAFI